VGAAVAGPLLICAGVLTILHLVLAGTSFPGQYDLRGYWLPTYCYLGKSIAAGTMPAWNPHTLAGTPFIADPQSGWFSPLVVLLFVLLPCVAALRWYLMVLPILAGLGMYWFLRSEGLSRPAATFGGLVLSLPVAGSAFLGLPWASGSLA